jgi:hypothetical protein
LANPEYIPCWLPGQPVYRRWMDRPLDIKPCVSVTPHINNHDYVGRPLDIKPCVSVTLHMNNHDFFTKISVQSKITRTLPFPISQMFGSCLKMI